MKKYIIITSIFQPNEAITRFANQDDWQLVVVGDRKTPVGWSSPNVIYLSPADQESLHFSVLKHLPWNHYSRKIIGYLYAIKNGADIIAESDDDNIPYENWSEMPKFSGQYDIITNPGFFNVYSIFTKEKVWPRGFPLNQILNRTTPTIDSRDVNIGIWQYLADDEPDVDAIYRLTINKQLKFDNRTPVVLSENTYCPFNSQNTFFTPKFYPLLYMPGYATARFTDILRGLIAQPVLHAAESHLAFGKATVYQERNDHDFLKDFESEIPCYLYAKKVIDICAATVSNTSTVTENLTKCYSALVSESVVDKRELKLLEAWRSDLEKLT